MTHVSQVNAAGQATFNWNPYVPVGTEVWENNRFTVHDLDMNLLSVNPHVIQDANSWATPAFLYDATQMAFCVKGKLYTIDNGEQAFSDVESDPMCSIHLSLSEGAVPETVLLEWNSPYAVTGAAAGGDFEIERLDDVTATWTLLATVPDSPDGGTFTDVPGPCAPTLVYRIRQVASNGVDAHVSNEPGLEFGSTPATPRPSPTWTSTTGRPMSFGRLSRSRKIWATRFSSAPPMAARKSRPSSTTWCSTTSFRPRMRGKTSSGTKWPPCVATTQMARRHGTRQVNA